MAAEGGREKSSMYGMAMYDVSMFLDSFFELGFGDQVCYDSMIVWATRSNVSRYDVDE